MFGIVNSSRPAIAAARRYLAARKSALGLGTNSSHIGWGIGALVIIGGVLAAVHSVWIPWMTNIFGEVTSTTAVSG